MKYFVLTSICIFFIFTYSQSSFCQMESQSTPIEPGNIKYPIKIGIFSGISLPLSPAELINKPTSATSKVQQSLLNGLNGLGYGYTMDIGIIVKYPLSANIILGGNIEYSGWKSINSCNCIDSVSKSENNLDLLQFGFLAQYSFYDKFFSFIEINLKFF